MKKAEDDKPLVARSAAGLGVRIPTDIAPAENGAVLPKSGGMSVAPSLKDLPLQLIPRRLRALVPDATGRNSGFVWTMGAGPFEEGPVAENLMLRPDRTDHGTVQPAQTMPLQTYEESLAATRDQWGLDEGGG